MLIFISGGVRSGKSTLGENLAVDMAEGRKIYLATSMIYDDEMKRRVQLHRRQRSGKGYITVEKSIDIGEILGQLLSTDTVLLDCLGNLLANEMFSDNPGYVRGRITDKIFREIKLLNSTVENLIIISNDVFSDGCRYSDSVVEYIDALGILHIKITEISDRAIECSAGGLTEHKTTRD